MDEFGPLNLHPHPGRQWAERCGKHKTRSRGPRRRLRATYARPHGVRHLFAAYDLGKDKLRGHIKKATDRSKFLEFRRYIIWRNKNARDERLPKVVDRANVA